MDGTRNFRDTVKFGRFGSALPALHATSLATYEFAESLPRDKQLNFSLCTYLRMVLEIKIFQGDEMHSRNITSSCMLCSI